MTRVLVAWLDGFSSRYLSKENTPFIHKLAKEGFYVPLKPMFAFAGIGASIFTGTRITTHHVWSDYVLVKQPKEKHGLFKWFIKACDLLPDDIVNQYARNLVYRLFRMYQGTPNLIPLDLIDLFELKLQGEIANLDTIGNLPTLFGILHRYNIKYLNFGLNESLFESMIARNVIRSLKDSEFKLILFRLGSLDRIGHKYGPESKEINDKLLEIDRMIERIVKKAFEIPEKINIIIFSEHGMAPVKRYVNLVNILSDLPFKVPKDYLFFINSTAANFWFRNENAKQAILKELGKLDCGFIFDPETLRKIGISEEYGELLFALKEGYVFFPDFYRRRKPPKGMHGYVNPSYDTPILILFTKDREKSLSKHVLEAEPVDIMPTILSLLNLPIPATCEGNPLMR
jgi:hypothetical protein